MCCFHFPIFCFADVITESLKLRREAQEAKKQAEEAKQEAEVLPVTAAADGLVSQLGDRTLIDKGPGEDASSQGKSKWWHVKWIYLITMILGMCT